MRLPVGRIRNRIPVVAGVKVSSSQTGIFELATTINVSQHGARVRVSKSWVQDERVFVASLEGGLVSQARAVSCNSSSGGSLAVGLEFLAPTGAWKLPE